MTLSSNIYGKILLAFFSLILIQFVTTNRVQAQITLKTTVMVNPNPGDPDFQECSTLDSITVNAGTPVMFCYKVTNTSEYTYNFHSLSSTAFGPILNTFPYTLTSGASVWLTEKTVINSTTVDDGTWRAFNTDNTPRYVIENINNEFVDISASGTEINIGDDDEADVTMAFKFLMAGIYSNQLTIGSNGAMRLGVLGAQISNLNSALSSDLEENIIAPMWDDLIPSVGGKIYYQTLGAIPNRTFIVQWNEYNSYDFGGSGTSPSSATFEVKLFESSNEIQFHYQDVFFDDANTNNGLSATVGISGGGNATQYSYNSANLNNTTAISFTRPYSTDYTISNSSDTSGPVYDFVDISATGTALGLSDDGEANVTMGFDFFFYNYYSRHVTIGNNGAIVFGQLNSNILAGNIELTDLQDDNNVAGHLIAPFWDDLSAQTGDVYYQTIGTAPNRVFIVQWNNRPHFSGGGGVGEVTFEVKLFEGSNVIEFHYNDVVFEDPIFDFGQSATIGVGGGINAVQFSYNLATITDNTALAFEPVARSATAADSAIAIVNAPDISTTETHTITLYETGSPANFAHSLDNLGLQALTWSVDDCGTDNGWLTILAPTSGTIAAGGTAIINLNADPTGMPVGESHEDICISSNDPDEALVIVDVVLNKLPITIFVNGFE